MPPANVFDEARDALERSVRELREQLSQAEEALEKLGGKATRRGPGRPGRPGRRGPGRPKGSTNKASGGTTAPRKRRKRRGGTRADQAVKLIEDQPGISASDVAKTMKIKPNYLYRVLGDLEKEGRVKKDGRQYYPTGG
jgi:predicted Rossmann fold nucleotide-binding protein DprA/Smf involved in DNA uptake